MLLNDSHASDIPSTVLVVDDDRINHRVMEHLLKDYFTVLHANNGMQALEIANQHPELALILLDIFMPDMNGYEVCQILKTNNPTKDIPVIFLTAADDENSERYGLELGAIDYITKPIKPSITKSRINNHIATRRYAQRLNLSNKIIENCNDGIIVTGHDKNIIDVNAAFLEITGYSKEDVIGQNPRFLNSRNQDPRVYEQMWHDISAYGYWTGELWNRKKNGEFYQQWTSIFAILDSRQLVSHYVGVFSDITTLKQRENQLKFLAHYDALTGIPNRMLLVDRLNQAIALTKRNQNLLAVCYIDLDGFKPINDTLGHHGGDLVLIEIAKRINTTIRTGDTVARIGGDEFVVLLTGLKSDDECQVTIQRILSAIGKPFSINELTFCLGASIGFTLFPLDNEDPEILLRHADQTMYSAKKLGRNSFKLFDPNHDNGISERQQTLKRIKLGILQNEFELFYQPKIEMQSGRVVGAEALIRWNHPERGLLYPADFLPIIESTNLIVEIGDWVIEQAIEQLNKWKYTGHNLQISVNVAGLQLQNEQFVDKLEATLNRYPLVPSGLLELEILETSALEIVESAKVMQQTIKKLGVSFALDDFGTGYSTLIYLKSLPAKTLKIDRTFVQDILEDAGDQAIVQGIIAMANTFKHDIIAEGVETPDHFQVLISMGCQIGQGYAIARPMPIKQFMEWLADKNTPRTNLNSEKPLSLCCTTLF